MEGSAGQCRLGGQSARIIAVVDGSRCLLDDIVGVSKGIEIRRLKSRDDGEEG
jgi:hypothetical protein